MSAKVKILKTMLMLFLFLIANNCGKKQQPIPAGVLNDEKMIDVFTDIRLAEASARVLNQSGVNSTVYIDSSYQLIYKLHQVEMWQIDSSLNFYCRHPKRLEKIFKQVAENLTEMSLNK